MTSSDPVTPAGSPNGWTGGQYSLVRGAFGLWLAWQFIRIWPYASALARPRNFRDDPPETIWTTLPSIYSVWASTELAQGVLAAGVLMSLLLAIGKWDRLVAVLVWYLWATSYAREPVLVGGAFPLLSWMLAVHVALPEAPYGSWDARGRVDPRGGWRMPAGVYVAVWGMLVAIHLSQAGQKLWQHGWEASETFVRATVWTGLPESVLAATGWALLSFQLAFGLLALWRPLRPAVWLLSLTISLASIAGGANVSLAIGLAIAHLLAFDPAWVPPRLGAAPAAGATGEAAEEWLFYDGHCGLCQRSVRLILAEDQLGTTFRFSPLGSDLFQRLIPEEARKDLPDSIVVRQADGKLLVRSAAILYVLQRLGGLWRLLGSVAAWFPRPLADLAYGVVARVRHRLFGRPTDACPIMPPDVRSRFEM